MDAPLGAQMLSDAVNKANETILEYAEGHATASGMGTTLVAARFVDGKFTIAHVGDSRIYLLRGGTLLQLTEDHSLVMEQVRRGILTVEEARKSHRSTSSRAPSAPRTTVHPTWQNFPPKKATSCC